HNKLEYLYGISDGFNSFQDILKIIKKYNKKKRNLTPGQKRRQWINEKDVVLITYGDQITEDNTHPLKSLYKFLRAYLENTVSWVHILPFYPFSSDDGFSVIDYTKVNPCLGEWDDIKNIGTHFNLMFDAVINHISAKSEWFEKYLNKDKEFENFFIEVDKNTDISRVVRPRILPLVTKFEKHGEKKYLWTTFSKDQIDLNYRNYKVLAKIIETLLFYALKGARLIRLDAVGYLWKEPGTSCIHLKKTHVIIQLFRDIFNIVFPEVMLITETNVPYKENITYFGNGNNEAQMIYQFPLAPLMLNSFNTENAVCLSKWADSLETPGKRTTFFNFLASHDGIGIIPARGILNDMELQALVDKSVENGGYISYKTDKNGKKTPYELNITFFDALSDQNDSEDIKIKKFIAAHSILLSMAGVPAIYINSMVGSKNYYKSIKDKENLRSINREKFTLEAIKKDLSDPLSVRFKIYSKLKELIKKRISEKAFHPNGKQMVLTLDKRIFSFSRTSLDKKESIISLTNFSDQQINVTIDLKSCLFKINYQGIDQGNCQVANQISDLISGKKFEINQDSGLSIAMRSYQAMWLKIQEENC
ncbi:MAG: sugar phosphorylase, partial [Deltaproteobacteria bacterium]|nr:sugar phosphorylase [Deltaproteobacteria bacterium]